MGQSGVEIFEAGLAVSPGEVVRLGPLRGRAWSDLDGDALELFAGDRDVNVRFTARTELARRGRRAVWEVDASAEQPSLL